MNAANSLKKLLNISLPVKLVLVILVAGLLQNRIDDYTASFFYTLSLTLKECIIFMLPFIIISSIYKSFTNLKGVPISTIPLLIIFMCLSNFINVIFSSNAGLHLIDGSEKIASISLESNVLPVYNFYILRLIGNDKALLLGFILGFISFYKSYPRLDNIMNKVFVISNLVLKRAFIPILPLFIFGFVLKAFKDDIFEVVATNFNIFGDILLIFLIYLIVLYAIASKFNFSRFVFLLKNVVTPFLTALTTMSSAVSLPFSIKATEENTDNRSLTRFYINSSVNIHMIGDSLSIPILTILLCNIFGVEFDTSKILIFASWYILYKFSGAGIPGGSMLIMSPLLESLFGFTPEMIGIITTLYIFIDPFTSASSVAANCGYAVILDNFINYRNKNVKAPMKQEQVATK